MPLIEGSSLFKNREVITEELIAEFQAAIPDVHTGEDSVVRILSEVMATIIESVFLSVQIVNEDMFVDTANLNALYRHGDEFGIYRKVGEKAEGQLTFMGTGGTVIPIGTEVAYDPLTGGDLLYFVTTEQLTIPNPGLVTAAPLLADGGAGALPAGTFEYVISFINFMGETEPGPESLPITHAAGRRTALTGVPIGGPSTISRRVYRQRDGLGYNYVGDIGDNSTTTFSDNAVENLSAPAPKEFSTAERARPGAEAEDSGMYYNVAPNTITILTTVPDGITDVINEAEFSGGTDPESPEDYRRRVIDAIRNPHTGSAADLKSWAEEVPGVETATVISNDNMGTPTPGHVTIRISGPDGTVPDAETIQAVYDAIAVMDIANITVHVGTFTPVTTAVSVTITLDANYILADISPSVVEAITTYVNDLEVGETFRVNGVVSVVMPLTGVADVAVTSPATNQATGATSKRVAGTITVS